MVFPSWLRSCAVMILMAGLLGLAGGCHSGAKNPSGTVSLSGYVSYTRTPVAYNTGAGVADPVTGLTTSGQPTGLGTPGGLSPARNVVLYAYQLTLDVDVNGKLNQVWRRVASAVTDSNGYYAFPSTVYAGYCTFVELTSTFQQAGGHQSTMQIIADPAGIGSSVAQPHRPIYVYRMDVNGSPMTYDPVADDPLSTSYPVPKITGDLTLNFNLRSSDTWLSTVPNWYVAGSNPDYPATSKQPQAHFSETFSGMGSKLLGILDNAYLVSIWYGDPTPSLVNGGAFDLHYYPGRTEASRRSFVVYDTSLTPHSYDGTKSHYFGSLAGGPTFDDAWDEGVIYPMLARNYLFGQGRTALFPTGLSNLPSESPDLAVVDGMADAMAANLLTTPWLTDTSATATAAFTPRDIRVIPTLAGVGSPATAAAVCWQLSLVATGITPPGTWTDWNHNWTYGSPTGLTYPPVMSRIYGLITPYTQYSGAKGTVTEPIDIASIYGQAGRLQEAQNGQPIDLSRIFSDLVLYTQLTPYNLTSWPVDWPLDLSHWPYQSTDWDATTNPTPGALLTTLPSFTLSMANASAVPNPALITNSSATPATVFPNVSQGEVAYAKLSLYLDQDFSLGLTASYHSGGGTVQGLPTGASIEVVVDPAIVSPALPNPQPQAFTFDATHPGPYNLSLTGNPTDHTNPTWHWVRFRLISPSVAIGKQPDVQITPTLQ